MTDLGPGDPPDEDFSKAKPSNQVAMNTFNTYIDPYFRPFSEEDLGFLRERGDRVTPYIMPTLGQHYSEVWAADEGGFASPVPASNKNPNVPKGSSDALSDDVLEKEEISCGPLLSRIMAAMIPEEGTIDSAPEPETPTHDSAPSAPSATTMPEATQPGWKVPTGKSDYYTLEERLQKEMQYIGLLGTNNEPDWKAREDDDVSAKLRELQKQLRDQSLINGARKARIAEHLKEQLAHQEYATILDDLDKQVCFPMALFYIVCTKLIQLKSGRTSILETYAQHEGYQEEEVGSQWCWCCPGTYWYRRGGAHTYGEKEEMDVVNWACV